MLKLYGEQVRNGFVKRSYVVYNSSSKKSPNLSSLNDMPESTPLILNDLTSILVRFRIHNYVVTTDIEKVFMHIGLDESDTTRFLWPSDIITISSRCFSEPPARRPYLVQPFELTRNNKHVPAAEVIERDI